MSTIKERLAKGFEEVEKYRINVYYMMVNPQDITLLEKEFNNSDELWSAKIIKTDVQNCLKKNLR